MPKDLHRGRSLRYTNRLAVRRLHLIQVFEASNKRKRLYGLIPALHIALARSGLGNPGAHCKNDTADTINPRLPTVVMRKSALTLMSDFSVIFTSGRDLPLGG